MQRTKSLSTHHTDDSGHTRLGEGGGGRGERWEGSGDMSFLLNGSELLKPSLGQTGPNKLAKEKQGLAKYKKYHNHLFTKTQSHIQNKPHPALLPNMVLPDVLPAPTLTLLCVCTRAWGVILCESTFS